MPQVSLGWAVTAAVLAFASCVLCSTSSTGGGSGLPLPFPVAHSQDGRQQWAKPKLTFNANGTFKIAQFADMHYGEGEDVDWGPQQDINSTRVQRVVLQSEQPDFVVYTGDQITGNNIHDNATAYWARVIQPCIDAETPWAIVFGNHDDLADGSGGTRKDLMAFDVQHDLSYSQLGPKYITGVSNYVLPIYSHVNDSEPAMFIYFLDSGGGSMPEVIAADQVSWYKSVSTALANYMQRSVPSVAFFHIPLTQYAGIFSPDKCFGVQQDGISPQDQDFGIFQAFLDMGDVKLMSVGHDHGNDDCCVLQGLSLCWGRHSAYGGYGDWARGARVFSITEPSKADTTLSFKSWVRMEDGSVIDGN